jgi:FtsP/CotA-like multicopper oxidase with cupredoxin domain
MPAVRGSFIFVSPPDIIPAGAGLSFPDWGGERRLMLTRRNFLLGGAGLAATNGLSLFGAGRFMPASIAAAETPSSGRSVPVRLVAAERATALPCFAGRSLPLWTYSDSAPWPAAIRIDRGDRLEVVLDNRLPRNGEHTSVHWHGVRVPNDQDGVPYLIQPPVAPGESFRYSFVPPDTGTYFFHPHCNTSEQLGRGLVGVLIVDGDAVQPYAADATIVLRDWLIDTDKGAFRSFKTQRGADRAGTYGNVRSANGANEAVVRLPASSDCRIRLINIDPTRIMELAVTGAEAAIIAVDGNALPPMPLDSWLLGPAMRLDLVVRAPKEGGEAILVDRRQDEPVTLARFIGQGPPLPARSFDPAPLRPGHIPEPDLAAAKRLSFNFGRPDSQAAAVAVNDVAAGLPIGPICTSSDHFWTINGRSWPDGGHAEIPPPLAVLERGRSYLFALKNTTPFLHPIHIHGHTFKVLRADQRPALPVHHADTVLVLPDETVEIAFVADNPGRWMIHCHVIEHQETGMMGYLQVV